MSLLISTSTCKHFKKIILFFKDVPDPRTSDNCDYSLSELPIILLMAVISGTDDVGILMFMLTKKWNFAGAF